MNDTLELAPAVRSILDAARRRDSTGGEPVAVEPRSLSRALAAAAGDRRPVIAEVKPTSPTTDARRDDDPVALARGMVAGGAAAVSVLTEPEHFGGSTAALGRVREAVDVPVLRKDFVLRESHLDAVAADAVLLVVRFLEDDLGTMVEATRDRGMQPLVEVHDREDLDRAIDAGATLIGINNRDLARLEVDLGTFERLAPHVPEDVTAIAESGIESSADAERMLAAGADGLLVGSAIMDGDVAANTRAVTGT
jgi:indole-3-glycerol phosphate synthase